MQSFIAYYLTTRYHASLSTVGSCFFVVGILQTASFLAAGRLGDRFGLLNTMVFSHLPSNVFLISIAFAPNLTTAIVLLFLRTTLSQMDVPTRQAYVMALVPPQQRVTAAATTNTARYLVRPIGPLLAAPARTSRSARPSSSPVDQGRVRPVDLRLVPEGAARRERSVAPEPAATDGSMNDSHSSE